MKLKKQAPWFKQVSTVKKIKKKKKKNRKRPLLNLPEEIIHEILRNLPGKSLCRFRCVCKPWKLQISDPNFFNSGNNFTFILSLGKSYSVEYDDSSASLSRKKETRHPFSFLKTVYSKILGSCNGLVCLSYHTLDSGPLYCLWNPYTEEYKLIPKTTKPTALARYLTRKVSHGFGYDGMTNDYKFVAITKSNRPGSRVDKYSLGSNLWSKPLYIPFELHTYAAPGVFFNGSLHWFAYSGVLIALNIGDGSVLEISQSESLDVNDKYVDVFGGCLGMLGSTKTDDFEVWMMKDYGVRESCVKMHKISRLKCLRRIVCSENGQVLLGIQHDSGEKTLVVHDLKNERCKTLNLDRFDLENVSYEALFLNIYVNISVSPNSDTYVGSRLSLDIYEKSLVSLKSDAYVGSREMEEKVLNDAL